MSLYYPPVTIDVDFLDGWLAGDGCLARNRNRGNPIAVFNTSKLTYAQYVSFRLGGMGLSLGKITRRTVTVKKGGTEYHCYNVYSHAHPDLRPIYDRWYPGGKKDIPVDFRVTPDSLLQWYLGDGFSEHGCPCIIDCSSSLLRLQSIHSQLLAIFPDGVTLRPFRGHSGSNRGGHLFYVRRRAVASFFDYIGPCPVSEYLYRWVRFTGCPPVGISLSEEIHDAESNSPSTFHLC